MRELAVQKTPGVKEKKKSEKHMFPTRGPLHNVASGITRKVVKKKPHWARIVAALKGTEIKNCSPFQKASVLH